MSFLAGLRKHIIVAAAVAFWIPAVAVGIGVLWNYSATPGREGSANAWPSDAPVSRQTQQPTLLMFVHPQCQCSRASIGELAVLMARNRANLDAAVFFFLPNPGDPSEGDGDWKQSALWETARAIPGVRTLEDRGATAARIFGAYTSGQTLLYGADGRLLFKGGITSSRGHSGDNAGRTAITALIERKIPIEVVLPVKTPVFGCGLRGE